MMSDDDKKQDGGPAFPQPMVCEPSGDILSGDLVDWGVVQGLEKMPREVAHDFAIGAGPHCPLFEGEIIRDDTPQAVRVFLPAGDLLCLRIVAQGRSCQNFLCCRPRLLHVQEFGGTKQHPAGAAEVAILRYP